MAVNTSFSGHPAPTSGFAPELQASIDELARETSRSGAQVVEDAVREYIRRNEWERRLLAEADASWSNVQGNGTDGCRTLEELTPWLESLGTDVEISPPFSFTPDGK